MNTYDNHPTPEPGTLSVSFKSERHAIEHLCLKVFGAIPVYPDLPTNEMRTDAENDTQCELAAWELLRECRHELDEAREQRDRLAEALRKLDDLGPPSKARSIIYDALAAVKPQPSDTDAG